VKGLNVPLIIAVRVAIHKAAGTPVQATETQHNGQTVYRVFIQSQSGRPKLIDVSQRDVDAEKFEDPSSTAECKPFREAKEEKIITAMRIAWKDVNGRLEKVIFEEYENHLVYSVTIQDSAGKYHVVRIDSDSRKILKHEVIGH
jgi:uncharacterized membrane protein YkoI